VSSLIRNIYLDSEIGVATDLVAAGTTLENPYVYDAAARELKGLADQGLVRITAEGLVARAQERLINRIQFERIR